jgi:5-formyltetrahydrofolate cyclo-ligase
VISGEIIELFRIRSTSDLLEGTYGIPEPLPEILAQKENIANYSSLSLILVPGLAFDIHGNRIGFGAGHYDRLLSKIPTSCIRIGIAFREQIVTKLPSDTFDQKMDYLLNEDGLISSVP